MEPGFYYKVSPPSAATIYLFIKSGRAYTVRNSRAVSQPKPLPCASLLTGLAPHFIRHWRRAASTPRSPWGVRFSGLGISQFLFVVLRCRQSSSPFFWAFSAFCPLVRAIKKLPAQASSFIYTVYWMSVIPMSPIILEKNSSRESHPSLFILHCSLRRALRGAHAYTCCAYRTAAMASRP